MALPLATLRDALASVATIELRPPATESEIVAFETRLDILLPAECRIFLLDVCDGISIDGEPWLYSMEDILVDLAPPRGRVAPSRDPSLPFLYDDASAKAFRRAIAAVGDKSLMEDVPFMKLQRRDPYDGCLTVGYNGGNDFNALVITGEQRGAVWRTGEIDLPELPARGAPDPDAPIGFMEWFVRWAKETLGVALPV